MVDHKIVGKDANDSLWFVENDPSCAITLTVQYGIMKRIMFSTLNN